jgi:uncharacterized membrane protein
MDFLNIILNDFIDVAILLFEFVGAIIIVLAGIKGVIGFVRKDPLMRLNLAKGLAFGLEFKLGSEILRTVIVREFNEMLVVGGIILLRAALTFLIYWEIRTEENHPEK